MEIDKVTKEIAAKLKKANYPSLKFDRPAVIQKWLREEKRIHIEIYANHSGWGWILTRINGTTLKEIQNDEFFCYYEQALEKGLNKAVDMILK